MKQFTIIQLSRVIIFLMITSSLCAQVIYVKHDAIGANDGTSWQNAFTDLETALAGATDDAELWVAGGVYHPGGSNPDTSSVFAVRNNVSIYGGFNGTETNLEERDPVVNVTTLSGDIYDDDILDDFTNNKSDNTRHVVYVDSLLSLVIIDGFTIKGGHTNNIQTVSFNRVGGGIYAISPVNINACSITGNFGRIGGGIFLTQGASNSSITQCAFMHNKTTDSGAGLYASRISDLLVANCAFTDNQTVRGALYPALCNNVLVENCLFQDNHNTTFGGGALFSFTNIELVIRYCDFVRNSATFGGAIVVNGTQIPAGTLTQDRIEHCRFIENMANDNSHSGAIYSNANPDISILDCEFRSNSAGDAGAVLIEQPAINVTDTTSIRLDSCKFINNESTNFAGGALRLKFTSAKVEHCLFEANTTNGSNNGGGGHVFINSPGKYIVFRDDSLMFGTSYGYAGAATAYGKDAQFLFENCVFIGNECDQLGGAVHHLGASITTYKNCRFEENSSETERGGALSMEDDSTTIHVFQSQFFSNRALVHGGAIFSGFGSGHITVDQCRFETNSVTAGFGGAIYIFQGGNDDIASLNINNSTFGYNTSNFGGGAVFVNDAELETTSCLFYGNRVQNGHGGAMSIVATDSNTVQAKILNTTFTENLGGLSDGLALRTGFTESQLTTTIQNCIFANQGSTNYAVEEGTPVLLSLGGNMSDDNSLSAILTHIKDLNLTSPIFNDPIYFDYSLTSNSPGIDAGVEGAPEFDILGNPRVNEPDMGAYENQMPVSIKNNLLQDQFKLLIYPNPVRDQNPNGTLINQWRGNLIIQVSDIYGRIVYSGDLQKSEEQFRFTLPMKDWNAGKYQVIVSNGYESIVKNIIRIE